jgi:hypothetical protein
VTTPAINQANFTAGPTATFTKRAIAAGSTGLCALIVQNTGAATTVAVSDSNGAYTQIAVGNPNTAFQRIVYLFERTNLAAAAAGANTITAVVTNGNIDAMWAIELVGAAPLDASNSGAAGSGTAVASGAVTTAEDQEFALGIVWSEGQNFAPDPGWLLFDTENAGVSSLVCQVVPTHGTSVNASGTQTASNDWVSLIVTLESIPSQAMVFVQGAFDTPGTQSTVSKAYPFAVSEGDILYATLNWSGAAAFSNIQDTMGNAWLPAPGVTSGSGFSIATYYARAKASGTTTVSGNLATAGNFTSLRIAQYSGVDSLDAATGQATTGSTPASPPVATRLKNELLVGTEFTSGVTTGVGAGFQTDVIDGQTDQIESRVVTAQGSYTATMPVDNPADTTVIQLAAFFASRDLQAIGFGALA